MTTSTANVYGKATRSHTRNRLSSFTRRRARLLLLSKTSSTSSSAFSLFGVGASSFLSPRSPVLCFFHIYLFLIHVFFYNITPPQFGSSFCGQPLPSSTFSLLQLLYSFSPHGLTVSVSLRLFSHLCLPLLLFLHS